MNNYQFCSSLLHITAENFSLRDTMECGQCFSYEQSGDAYAIVHRGNSVLARQEDGQLLLSCTQQQFDDVWREFFALDSDYDEIKSRLCADNTLARAVGVCGGIRLLRQDVWETTLQFIISQNNNIKRIRGIVTRLRDCFGEALQSGIHAYPTPQALAGLAPDDLEPLRCGFRAGYLLDAARRFADGSVDPDFLKAAPLEQADEMLRRVRGIGPKVSACILLFGAQRYAAFPRDVWINRAMAEFYPNGFPDALAPLAGVAQQYLFHYSRTVYDFEEKHEKPCE